MKKQHSHWHAATLFVGWLVSLGVLAISGTAAATTNSSTADHSKFKELQQNFKSGPEVTKACLKCHTEAAKQIQKTTHWTWNIKPGERSVTRQNTSSTTSASRKCPMSRSVMPAI
jgi:cytochrome c2